MTQPEAAAEAPPVEQQPAAGVAAAGAGGSNGMAPDAVDAAATAGASDGASPSPQGSAEAKTGPAATPRRRGAPRSCRKLPPQAADPAVLEVLKAAGFAPPDARPEQATEPGPALEPAPLEAAAPVGPGSGLGEALASASGLGEALAPAAPFRGDSAAAANGHATPAKEDQPPLQPQGAAELDADAFAELALRMGAAAAAAGASGAGLLSPPSPGAAARAAAGVPSEPASADLALRKRKRTDEGWEEMDLAPFVAMAQVWGGWGVCVWGGGWT